MKRVIIGLVLIGQAAGCAAYTRTKVELTTQAQRGIANARRAADERATLVTALVDRQRTLLDAAFDADVLATPDHDAAWMLAHRKAYALAIDALVEQRRTIDTATAAAATNLHATEAALAQLQRMHATEMQFSVPEVSR